MEQVDRKAEPSQMLQTTRLLEAELHALATQPPPGRVTPTKIAVMMPSAAKIAPSAADVPAEALAKAGASAKAAPDPTPKTASSPAPEAPVKNGAAARQTPVTNGAPPVNGASPVNGAPSVNGASAPNGVPVPQVAAVAPPPPASRKEPERGVWPFDPLAEKPTDRFTLSQKSREINDIIGGGAGNSLNEKLKSEIADLRSALNDAPIRDLKKAIGVNDRYVFVNQLFRGDEAMYERSIKTINGFRILPEAEYWMERELKVKLGWDENREITRHFYQLVKRRFS